MWTYLVKIVKNPGTREQDLTVILGFMNLGMPQRIKGFCDSPIFIHGS